jgi:hydroxyacylglutathione hydrolase
VDPVEPDKVLAVVDEARKTLPSLRVSHVLTTHKHSGSTRLRSVSARARELVCAHRRLHACARTARATDHAGGNEEFARRVKGVEVVGGKEDAVAGCTRPVADGERLALGQTHVRVLHVPCHTRGHVWYLVEGGEGGRGGALLSGDTLFVAGCGKFFEGSAEEMHHALCVRARALPGDTRVFCGHEYTVSNLLFALAVEPDNVAARNKLAWARDTRARGLPTVPSTLADELATNPFMRVGEAAVRAFTGKSDAVEVMAELRRRKNEFKPPAL